MANGILAIKATIIPHLKQKRIILLNNEGFEVFFLGLEGLREDFRGDFTGVFLLIGCKYKELKAGKQSTK